MGLDRFFRLSENGTSARTEIIAGLTTFLTMAYIIFVQPAVLSGAMFGFRTGMDFGAVTTATCLASAIASAIMGLYGRYPIALAPGMGENFFFVFSVIPAAAAAGFADPWRTALGVVFLSGILFYVVYLLGIREKAFDSISPSMKNGIAVGIGLFIAFIGLQNTGLIVTAASIIPADPPILAPATLVKLNSHFASPDILVFFFGLVLTAVLHTRRVRGSILWGILGAATLSVAARLLLPRLAPGLWALPEVQASRLVTHLQMPEAGVPAWQWFVSQPPSPAATAFKMDLAGALSLAMWPFILIFLFMDVFDTIGTLVGVSEQGGFIKDNKLPRARQAMLADQAGTLVGACLGTSTVTSFIESAAGVEQGGRTGLTSLTTAILFLLALFFSPLIALVGSYPPITAPALVVVGAMMMQNVRKIDWGDYSEAIPAFLTILGIPLSYSIADGLAIGFISYPVVKFLAGRGREVRWLMYALAIVLALYFVLVRARLD
jgi:AGZA family xanthine/uracil permease-like MFS transporter